MPAALLPDSALVLTGVSSADDIFHYENRSRLEVIS